MSESIAAVPVAACHGDFDVYEVAEYGTLTRRGAHLPDTQREALDITDGEPVDVQQLCDLAADCVPLTEFLLKLAKRELEQRWLDLDEPDDAETEEEREDLQMQLDEIEKLQIDVDRDSEGLRAWLGTLCETHQQEILAEARRWLDGAPDWLALEAACILVGPQVEGLRFFESLDSEVLDLLGVKLIYGEHPGSSYYAAELTLDPREANARAREAGLPLRFVHAGRPFLELVHGRARS